MYLHYFFMFMWVSYVCFVFVFFPPVIDWEVVFLF